LDPMISAAEQELEGARVTDRSEVVLADAGYWSNGHIDALDVRAERDASHPLAEREGDQPATNRNSGWSRNGTAPCRSELISKSRFSAHCSIGAGGVEMLVSGPKQVPGEASAVGLATGVPTNGWQRAGPQAHRPVQASGHGRPVSLRRAARGARARRAAGTRAGTDGPPAARARALVQ